MPDTPVIVTDEQTLREAVQEAVDERLQARLGEVLEEAQKPEWADKEYVRERFGWTDRQLQYLRNEGRIDYSKRGRRILYHVPSLEEYLEKGRVRPSSGPLAEEEG
jgi:hypothetical protein